MTVQPSPLSLAHFASRVFLKWGGYGLLVIGARQQDPLVIMPALDSMLVIDGAKRHALSALLRSSSPVLKMVKRQPSRYSKAFVAFSVTADGSIDIEACDGDFDHVPFVERLTPHEVCSLFVLMNAAERPRARPDGLPGVSNVRGHI